MSDSYYLGPRVRPIRLDAFTDVEMAAAEGHLDETQWVELKEAIGSGSKENLETAKDLASLSVDGGLLIVGVKDAKGRPGEVVGVELAGLADRLAQVAAARVDPPLNITTRELERPDAEGRGILLVTIAASLTAPHMVDGSYWGRGAVGKRKLADSEVRRLVHERDRRAASFAADLQTLPSEISPVPESQRQLAHAHLLLRPASAGSGVALSEVLHQRSEHPLSVVTGALGFMPQYAPTIADATRLVPHPDGYELNAGLDNEEWAVRLILGEDGAIKIFYGRASYRGEDRDESREYISPGAVIELAHCAVRVAGHVGASALGYHGLWHVGILVDKLKGLPSSLARSAYHTRIASYPKDVFQHVIQTGTDEMLLETPDVVRRLMRPFVRGLGAEFMLEYDNPATIGDTLSR